MAGLQSCLVRCLSAACEFSRLILLPPTAAICCHVRRSGAPAAAQAARGITAHGQVASARMDGGLGGGAQVRGKCWGSRQQGSGNGDDTGLSCGGLAGACDDARRAGSGRSRASPARCKRPCCSPGQLHLPLLSFTRSPTCKQLALATDPAPKTHHHVWPRPLLRQAGEHVVAGLTAQRAEAPQLLVGVVNSSPCPVWRARALAAAARSPQRTAVLPKPAGSAMALGCRPCASAAARPPPFAPTPPSLQLPSLPPSLPSRLCSCPASAPASCRPSACGRCSPRTLTLSFHT